MKRERKWLHIGLDVTYHDRLSRKLSITSQLVKTPHLLIRDSKLGNNISIPSLKYLQDIKKEKLFRIKWLIQNERFDTTERQKETAKKIINALLAS
jgi:hypothetical protein